MSGGGRRATERELFGAPADYAQSIVEFGTAGWEGDDTVEDLGTVQNGGRTLVKVTLFKGRDRSKRPKAGAAAGHRIRVQIMGPLYLVPPKGKLVLVVFPGGDITSPGAGVLMPGWVDESPQVQFRADRAVLDVGPTMDLVIKAKSVTLSDQGAKEGRFASWLTVGPSPAGGAPGITANDPKGGGFTFTNGVVGIFATDGASPPDVKALLQLSPGEATLLHKSGGYYKIESSGDTTSLSTGKYFGVYSSGSFGPGVGLALGVAIGPTPGTVSVHSFFYP